ncbi:MAG: hypothetical protein KF911_08250 [Pseudomonadales bacterium]|nr:hypothetical protein [Pseudomonadales bacterium]
MLLIAGALFLVLATTGFILLALHAPQLGIDLTAEDGGLRITHVAIDSPNRDIATRGGLITQLAGHAPDADLLIDDPDHIGAWERFNALLQTLDLLHEAAVLGAIPVTIDDSEVLLAVRDRRVSDLPALFWIQLTTGAIAFLIALVVFAFRSNHAGARQFMVLGIAGLLTTGSHAIFSTRELIFHGAVLGWLSRLNSLGVLLFGAALVSLFWVYPRHLHEKLPVIAMSYAMALLLWLAILMQITPDTSSLHLVVLVAAITSMVLAVQQWRSSRRRPIERAALRWFMLVTMPVSGLFAVVTSLPPAAGYAGIIGLEVKVGMAMLLVLSMFFGILLGITRYRLFDLERWWFTAWGWFLGGFAVLALDVALVATLGMAQAGALPLALALVGWLYFPARQWLWKRVTTAGDQEKHQREWMQTLSLAADESSLRQQWRRILQQAFAPLQMVETSAVEAVGIEAGGQALAVPDIAAGCGLRLHHAAGGARLFSREDLRTADLLLAMARMAHDAMQEREHRVLAERQRIRRDLHDDLGAKLLSLIYRTDGPTQQLARSAISDMRDILTALDAEPLMLDEALATWRAEAQERAELHGFTLDWDDTAKPHDIVLSARQHTNLVRVLREAISNAVRHATTRVIVIRCDVQDGRLHLWVSSHGDPGRQSSTAWKPGLGIQQTRRRIDDLGGSVHWEDLPDGHRLVASIPLEIPSGR